MFFSVPTHFAINGNLTRMQNITYCALNNVALDQTYNMLARRIATHIFAATHCAYTPRISKW